MPEPRRLFGGDQDIWRPGDSTVVSRKPTAGPPCAPAARSPPSFAKLAARPQGAGSLTERLICARPRRKQFWLSPARTGPTVTLWIDTTTVHLSTGGWRIKTVPSRLSEVDLARLRHADACPAGPPPAGPSPGVLAASQCVEVDRLVNGTGGITLLNRLILVGSPLAGQRAGLRLDGQLMHVITQDGVLWRTLPCPIPPGQRHRLQGVRLAGPAPLPDAALAIQRRVSSPAASKSP